jgi:hypothetical protein
MEKLEFGKLYDLPTLVKFSLKKLKPIKYSLVGYIGYSKDRSDLCVQIVHILVKIGLITEKKLPVYNALETEKYFINREPRHEIAHLDHNFKQIQGYGIFVDVKYTSDRQLQNIIHLFEHLHISPDSMEIALRG